MYKIAVSEGENMVFLGMEEVAKKILAAAQSGAIQPGQNFSLPQFASATGISTKSAQRLLETIAVIKQTRLDLTLSFHETQHGVRRSTVEIKALK